MHEFQRGKIISKNDNLNLRIDDFYSYNGQIKKMEIEAKDGVINFDNKTPHSILLDTTISYLYNNKEKREKFGVYEEKILLNGFHTPEINSASYIASLGEVVSLYFEIPEEEKIGTRYEGTDLTRSLMLYLPENKEFSDNQKSYLQDLDIDVEIFGLVYAGKSIDDIEVFSSYDAREEFEYLKEEMKSACK